MRVFLGDSRPTRLLTGVCLSVIAAAPAGPARAQTGSYHDVVCHPEYREATPAIALPNESPLGLDRAMTLFRFHRRKQAVAAVDAALKLAAGPWRHRVPFEERRELTADLESFRRCLATRAMPAMATLTVHVLRFEVDDAAPQGRDAPAAGAAILVEDVLVGRTGDDGTLTVQAPSGEIHVRAEIPRTYAGQDYVNLAPGSAGAVSIGLHEGKDVTEGTALMLVEAVDDIVPASSPSLTLRFGRDGVPVPIAEIESVDVVGQHGERESIQALFAVVDGAVAAINPGAFFASMAGRLHQTITVSVSATDASGLAHVDHVGFRVGQSGFTVTLAAPPSNPAVPVGNVEVGVSVIGAGIAVQRVSDASGRFDIESFPHGSIAFDAEVRHGNRYYYGQATMAHFGQRSVTLLLRHVSDVVNGVPALELGPAAGDPPPAPRRSGGAARP